MSENETPVQTNRLNFGAETEQAEAVQTAEAEAQPEAVVEEAPVEETNGVRHEDAEVPAGEPESNEAYQTPAIDQEQAQENVTEETVEAADQSVGEVAAENEAVLEATTEAVADTGTPVAVADAGQGDEAVSKEAVETPRVEIAAETDAANDASVAELKAKQAESEAQIASRTKAEKESVLAQIKTVATTYGITANEVADYLGGYRSKRLGVPAKAKYRDPATGKTWSGRGKAPLGLKDQDRTKYLITE